MPRSLNFSLPDFEIVRFPDRYFTSVLSYNKLVLTDHFYRTFLKYKYILLYQLDALVFSDQLMEWCERDFDYVGAPWLKNANSPEQGFSNVGNGGFSLRKVETALAVLDSREVVIDASEYWTEFQATHTRFSQILNLYKKYLKRFSYFSNVRWYVRHPHDMEDIFWANIAPKIHPRFKIAPVAEALKFSFESAPRYCFEQNNFQLPFGCHSWEKYDRGFWEPYLLRDES